MKFLPFNNFFPSLCSVEKLNGSKSGDSVLKMSLSTSLAVLICLSSSAFASPADNCRAAFTDGKKFNKQITNCLR